MFNLFKSKSGASSETKQIDYNSRYLREELRDLREKILAIENYLGIRMNKRWRADKIKKIQDAPR